MGRHNGIWDENIITLQKFCQIYYSFYLLVRSYVCLKHNSKTTAQMVIKFLGSIRTVTKKN